MNELATLQAASVHNQVYPVQKPEYSKEVTEASNKYFVLVLLTSSSGTNEESRLLIEVWRELARKFGDVKFCQMQANLCIEGYPDRNTPTILIYKDGEIRKQIVTLRELRGVNTGITGMCLALVWPANSLTAVVDIEKILLDLGAIKHNDSRLKRRDLDADQSERQSSIKQGNRPKATDDDDSDWE